MVPMAASQRLALGGGLLALSQRAADLRERAQACAADHTALIAEALRCERVGLELPALIESIGDELPTKDPPATPAVATGEGGSPTRT